jgi:indolepyruvate decarboxylase
VVVIAEGIGAAKSVVAFPASTILRFGLQKQVRNAIEALGCPFAATLMEKSVSDPKTYDIVEGADRVLDLGGANLNNITTASYAARRDPSRFRWAQPCWDREGMLLYWWSWPSFSCSALPRGAATPFTCNR